MASARSGNSGVQSLQRAFELLERLADAGGEASLSELAASSGLPMPTIHRLIRTLVTLGYVRQNTNRRYALGARLIRLGENASLQFGTWARPLLAELVDEVGETANLAVLERDEVVYVAQVASNRTRCACSPRWVADRSPRHGVGRPCWPHWPRTARPCYSAPACRLHRAHPHRHRLLLDHLAEISNRVTPSTPANKNSACGVIAAAVPGAPAPRRCPSQARRDA